MKDMPESIKKIIKNFKKRTCNNYRKMHGLPMRRWKQEYKVEKYGM